MNLREDLRHWKTLVAFLVLCILAYRTGYADSVAPPPRVLLSPSLTPQADAEPEDSSRQHADAVDSRTPHGTGPLTLQQPQPVPSAKGISRVHVASHGCLGEHDALISTNGSRIEFYPYAPPYRFDHLLIHYADGDEVWGQPSYTSVDCPDSNRCQRAIFRLNPVWQACVPTGHLYEVRALDNRPVLLSSVLQVIDLTTGLSVNANLTILPVEAIPTDGILALELGELAEESGSFKETQHFIDIAAKSLEGTKDVRVRTDIEGSLRVASGNMQRDLGNYLQAFKYYSEAVQQYRSVQDHKNAADTLNKIAEAYRQLGDYPASVQWYDYSLQESQGAGDIDAQLTALLRLNFLSAQVGDLAAQAKYKNKVSD